MIPITLLKPSSTALVANRRSQHYNAHPLNISYSYHHSTVVVLTTNSRRPTNVNIHSTKHTTQSRAVYQRERGAAWRQIMHSTGQNAMMRFIRWIKHPVLHQRQAGADPKIMEGAGNTMEETASGPSGSPSAFTQAHSIPTNRPSTKMSTAEKASPGLCLLQRTFKSMGS